MQTRGERDRGTRTLLIVLLVLVLVALAAPLLSGGMMGGMGLPGWGMMGPGMMGGYGGAPGGPGASVASAGGWMWGAGMALGWLAMLAFWGALAVGVVGLVRWLTASGGRSGTASGPGATAGGESALDILRRRLAVGEITEEEFERLRRVVEG
jgi:putative membrane protein